MPTMCKANGEMETLQERYQRELQTISAEEFNMQYTHTPGPWYFSEPFEIFPGASLCFHISQEEGAPYTPEYSDVAVLSASTIRGEKLEIQRANARLIAAAPELLEALKYARRFLKSQEHDTVFVDNIIVKATGEQA